MNIRLLSHRDCEKLIDFVNENKNMNQIIQQNVFSDFLIIRNMMFHSRMIAISECDAGGNISKLFSVIPPHETSIFKVGVIVAFNTDVEFMKKSIELLNNLIHDKNFTKLKFIVNMRPSMSYIINSLDILNFKCEVHILTNRIDQKRYAYFLEI